MLSPSDVWREVLTKVAEYLRAGVRYVCVLHPAEGTVTVYAPDRAPEMLSADAALTLPDIMPGFSVPVREFFG